MAAKSAARTLKLLGRGSMFTFQAIRQADRQASKQAGKYDKAGEVLLLQSSSSSSSFNRT
jgi:hypothetical protein